MYLTGLELDISRYVLKLPNACASIFKPTKEIFGPNIKFIFSTRQLKPSITSLVKVWESFEPKDFEGKYDFLAKAVGLPYDPKYRPLYHKYHSKRFEQTDVQRATLATGASLAGFMENKDMYDFVAIYEEMVGAIEEKIDRFQEAKFSLGVRRLSENIFDFMAVYDGMIENVKLTIAEMFGKLNIPLAHVDEAAKALDSYSKQKIFDISVTSTIDESEWILADQILSELDLPFRISMEKNEFIQLIKS